MRKLNLLLGVLCLVVSVSITNAQYGSKANKKDVVDIAVSSSDHTTLVEAVKAAGLVDTLKGKGPFTVFAPVNSAFEQLPAGTVESLLKPENKDKLQAVLTYHVVQGKFRSKDVLRLIKRGGGKATVKTLQGGTLTLTTEGGNVKVTDENGNTATVTKVDLIGSNGIIHVIDKVVLPKR